MTQQHIAVLDDEEDIRQLLATYLGANGFRVTPVQSGGALMDLMVRETPALVLLDLGLPGEDGFAIARRLRERWACGLVIVTGRGDAVDKIVGLEIGADDYVTKPFSPRELVLRVKALLRRGKSGDNPSEQIRIGPLLIDVPRHSVHVQNCPIDLTATEFKLLAMLAQRRGRVLTRDMLLRDVWQYDATIDSRTVDTHMRRLREKLGPAAKYLDTVRGVGYRFAED